MNLKKGMIYNTPLNPLSRGEFLGSFFKRGVIKKIFYQEGSFWGVFSRVELYPISVDMQQIYYMNKCLFKENMV
jgi:hypothetical protein